MSGDTPDWLGVDSYVMLNGKKSLVTNYFFTSEPGHNNDSLWVEFGKLCVEFRNAAIRPLPPDPQKIPAFAVKGAIVEYPENGEYKLSYLESIYTREIKGEAPETFACVSNYPFGIEIENIREVSPENKSEEARLREVYENQRFFRDSPYMRRIYAVSEFHKTKKKVAEQSPPQKKDKAPTEIPRVIMPLKFKRKK